MSLQIYLLYSSFKSFYNDLFYQIDAYITILDQAANPEPYLAQKPCSDWEKGLELCDS